MWLIDRASDAYASTFQQIWVVTPNALVSRRLFQKKQATVAFHEGGEFTTIIVNKKMRME